METNITKKHAGWAKLVATVFAVGMAYRMLAGLQGVDHVDAGFCNTFYQLIFSRPDANEFNFIYYLTGFLGGLWEQAFGQFGLAGFRFLEALTLSAAVAMLYLTFRDLMPRRYSVLAAGLSFLFPVIVVTFHYDTLSYLLMAVSAWCYSRFAASGRRRWIVAAGAAVGFAFFARMVNLSLLALLAVPLVSGWRRSGWRRGCADALRMAAGMAAGSLTMLMLIAAMGHMPHFTGGLREAFSAFSGHSATHSHDNLIRVYFASMVNMGLQMAVAGLFWYAGSLADRRLGGRLRHIALGTLAVAYAVVALASLPYVSALALSLVIVAAYTATREAAQGVLHVTTAYLFLSVMLFPAGSDIGIPGIFNWCAGLMLFPAAACTAALPARCNRRVAVMLLVAMGAGAMVKSAKRAYGDTAPRTASTTLIQPGRLNVYTNAAGAARYRHYINIIGRYGGADKPLLLGNQFSELYYATRMIPFLGHTQTVIYQGESLRRRLEERRSSLGEYPLVVFLKHDGMMAETSGVQTVVRQWMANNGYTAWYMDKDMQVYGRKQGR